MRIAVLSGKGGTGKTLISVNLAAVSVISTYIDCDVEEPNGHLFFKPEITICEPVTVKIPYVEEPLCTGCRLCVDFCMFNALAYIQDKLLIFEDICHSCGGCVLLCPEKALREKDKTIGKVQEGMAGGVKVITGFLEPGEASGIPIIKRLLKNSANEQEYTFIDCPPGSACIVMESIKEADYCILVAEPTLFGVHNLEMVHQLIKLFNKPHGAVLNKSLEGENPSEEYCLQHGIKILGRIPFDHHLGTINSNARMAVKESPKYRDLFKALLDTVLEEAQHETALNP